MYETERSFSFKKKKEGPDNKSKPSLQRYPDNAIKASRGNQRE